MKVLPTNHFDSGTVTATPDIKARMSAILAALRAHGIDLSDDPDAASRSVAESALHELRQRATVLFLLWERARQAGNRLEELALARLFNGVTRKARKIDGQFDIVDKTHFKMLEAALREQQQMAVYDPQQTAHALDTMAQAHDHERAWLWVVLPTFARQPYGRILLFSLPIAGSDSRVFVTQPFFLSQHSTLFHTHGRNWAFARPLGRAGDENKHINTLWLPQRASSPFPLKQMDFAEYDSDCVIVIPPRAIHGISRKRGPGRDVPPLAELMDDAVRKEELIAQTRFGELGCIHIYSPHKPLMQELSACPLLKEDQQFFIENDMIVFDHVSESIWAGGGGSWPRRMVEFGTSGDHCGTCYEDDPRRENLDPQLVSEWLIETPPPRPIFYRF